LHWVGDLAVEFELQVSSDAGEVVLELIEGDDVHQCRIDVATGEALLQSSGPETFAPRARTAIKGPGIHKVMFANLDNQLFLWIDGDEVVFDTSTQFISTGSSRPSDQDLSPIGIGAKGVTATVRHLRVLRDIYYIATAHGRGRGDLITEHAQGGLANSDIAGRHKSLTEPQQWAYTAQEVEFPLAADQFLMLGDNSPKSKDSRLWDNEQFVRRDLLVGKALYVYWPHALDDTAPMFPNFPLMRFVR
jgi:signal peptidase I